MKKLCVFIIAFLIAYHVPAHAQFGNMLKKAVEKKVEKEIESVLEGEKQLESAEEEVKTVSSSEVKAKEDAGETVTESSPALNWAGYDFIPGTELIFEDNQENEENGEFPSRWDLVSGRVENAEFGNENVIFFMERSSSIIPYLKNRESDYLPEEFTLEFDAYYEKAEYASYQIYLVDKKNHRDNPGQLSYPAVVISANEANANIFSSKGTYPGKEYGYNRESSFWRHISLSFNRRVLKVYIDDARVLNIPNVEQNPSGITIACDGFSTAGVKGHNRFIRNVRLAKGAVKLYDKFLVDGRIQTNAIRFETGKSTIKPESMGVINEVYEMLKDHSEIRLRIEGHTDNTGGEDINQSLSESRAQAVKEKLVEMGINASRLESKGWGESQPVDSNDSPEGRANNRRVVFVKI